MLKDLTTMNSMQGTDRPTPPTTGIPRALARHKYVVLIDERRMLVVEVGRAEGEEFGAYSTREKKRRARVRSHCAIPNIRG